MDVGGRQCHRWSDRTGQALIGTKEREICHRARDIFVVHYVRLYQAFICARKVGIGIASFYLLYKNLPNAVIAVNPCQWVHVPHQIEAFISSCHPPFANNIPRESAPHTTRFMSNFSANFSNPE